MRVFITTAAHMVGDEIKGDIRYYLVKAFTKEEAMDKTRECALMEAPLLLVDYMWFIMLDIDEVPPMMFLDNRSPMRTYCARKGLDGRPSSHNAILINAETYEQAKMTIVNNGLLGDFVLSELPKIHDIII